MVKIAVIEDDMSIRTLISFYLTDAGFDVNEFKSASEALEILPNKPVDLIISDIMLPGIDGYIFCEEVRQFSNVPFLMITAKSEQNDINKGFRAGTDDYLVKPFDPEEMVLRVKSLLRRANISTDTVIHFGNLMMNQTTYELNSNVGKIELKLKEYELLCLLANHPKQILTREQLIERVWGYGYEGNDRTLDVHIRKLREHFERLQANLEIKTVRGIGYGLEVLS